MKLTHPPLRSLLLAASLLGTVAIGAPPAYPRASIDGIALDSAASFNGNWQMGFPEGDGVIVAELLVSCDSPVVLTGSADDQRMHYRSPAGSSDFEIMAFAGRSSWLPEAGESAVAVWTRPDQFFLYRVDATTGRAQWDDPRVYSRCPAASADD